MSYTDMELVREVEVFNGQMGIVARVDIPCGCLIGIYDGLLIRVPLSEGCFADSTNSHREIVQVAQIKNTLFGLVTAAGEPLYGIDFINHSCKPNVSYRDRITLYAMRDIAAGEPLVMDYRKWDFVAEGILCWCDNPQCTI